MEILVGHVDAQVSQCVNQVTLVPVELEVIELRDVRPTAQIGIPVSPRCPCQYPGSQMAQGPVWVSVAMGCLDTPDGLSGLQVGRASFCRALSRCRHGLR